MARSTPRMTASQTTYAQAEPSTTSIAGNGFYSILRACRQKATMPPPKRAQGELIDANTRNR